MVELRRIIDDLLKLPLHVKQELDHKLRQIAYSIQQEARNNHRYVTRTGKLEASTIATYTDTGIYAYLDTGVAPYGVYVHQGHRSWAPDPFLENAFVHHQADIDAAISDAIDNAFKS